MSRFLLLLVFNIAFCASGFSQEFVFEETSLRDSRNHHSNQVWMLVLSLKEYRLRPQIEFSEGYDFNAVFEKLSKIFKQTIPADYWKAEVLPGLGDSLSRISSPDNFIRWTFGKIEKDKTISYYGQLIVYFSDTSTSATVTRVLVKKSNEFTVPDSIEVLQQYKKYEADQLKNPSPSLPPPIRGN